MSNPWFGSWTCRSLLNDPDRSLDFDKFEFGGGTIILHDDPADELLNGTLGGEGRCLALHGSRACGSSFQVRFQGKGLVSGKLWIYDYIGFAGSAIRIIPRSSSNSGTAPASVVSFCAGEVG